MRKFRIQNDLSGVIKRTAIRKGGTLISKVSVTEAQQIADRPVYFSVNVEPNPGTDNTFKIAFDNNPVRGKYLYGTEVIIYGEVGYAITAIYLNGEEQELDNRTLTFNVLGPTDIVVETKALYTVTFSPATGNFTATYSMAAVGGEYIDGTILTLAPAEGHILTGITINGAPELSDEIEINRNMTVVITTVALITVNITPATGDFTVEADNAPVGEKYLPGTTFTITATEGHTITEVTANSVEVTAVAGVYTVIAMVDTTIAITVE